MRGKWILASGIAVLLAVAAGALTHLRSPAPVRRNIISKLDSPATDDLSLTGQIEAQRTVAVAAPTEGTIGSFLAEVGQEVFQGQVLAQISSQELQADEANAASDLSQAQSRINALEATLLQARLEADRAAADAGRARSEADRQIKLHDRQQLLLREGATPRLVAERVEREYSATVAELQSAEAVAKQAAERVTALTAEIDSARRVLESRTAELERAKADVAASEVHSPVTGVVVARRGQVGDNVDTGTKDLFQVAVDLSQMKVVVQPKSADLPRVHPGLRAVIRLSENGNEPLAGLVRDVHEGRATIEFQNPNPAVKPGLTAQVQIRLT